MWLVCNGWKRRGVVAGWQLAAAGPGGRFAVELELGAGEASWGQGEDCLGSLGQPRATSWEREAGVGMGWPDWLQS